MLGANPVPLQVPIGAEDDFTGVVDLLTGKAMVWNEEDKGMTFTEDPVPADLVDVVEEYRGKLVEAVAEQDDTLMEKYFEDPDSITEAEMVSAIRKATIAMDITPMLCGSAFKNKGVQTMLDAVMRYLPSPYDIGEIVGMNPDDEEKQEIRNSDPDEPFAGLAFKIATDPFVGRLCFVRAYSGTLPAGSYVKNTRSDKKERISRIFQMHSNKQNPIDQLEAGDIGAVVGFKDIRTGDTLCSEGHPITLESMTFPDPVIGVAIEPKSQADIDKLGNGLVQAFRGGSHIPCAHRRGQRPNRDLRNGRAAPGRPRGPLEARVQGGVQPGSASGGLQGGHLRRSSAPRGLQEAVGWPR